MARSAKGNRDEDLVDDDDEQDLFTSNTSSSLNINNNNVKGDEPSRGKRANTHRSKHSETEQRRRSKINERFQVLRDLIPQNDQKRDKASFLLEVIEYIQFLQEKLQIYEQSYEGWNQEPTKLTPWRNHHGPADNTTDPSRAIQNGSVREKNNNVSPSLPKNIQNSIDSDLSTTIEKGHTLGLAGEAVPMTMQMRLDMFDPVVSSGIVSQQMPELPLSNADKDDYIVADNTLKEQEELTSESGSDSISNAYSQRILGTLTQTLQSSGVDLSQASVSVQVDVGRRTDTRLTSSPYGSKGHENPFASDRAMACSGIDYFSEDSELSPKRFRREAS
ncbi:transcription factor BIM2-like isoform X2 [Cicer arietinum]|uniref:Transcription factor BIM2-like isoform X2 n=1 Tax=Cicer arietinum TaxID=3827 RepID=A0A1S2XN80_CICAR|nr:transcription factor BIM2-like isoform X2 [Cicer arietinum]